MTKYERTELIITEFDAEDVITTSGVTNPDPNKTITMNSPNYSNNSNPTSNDFNWTLWQ